VTTPFQNFNLDLTNIARVLSLIANGTNTLPEIAKTLGMGERKVRDSFEWCHHLGHIEVLYRSLPQSLTTLGRHLVRDQTWTTRLPLLDILYASLTREHKIINQIVNRLAYAASLRFSSQFSLHEYRTLLASLTPDVVDAKPQVILDRSSKYLNALVEPTGLGKLGMFFPTNDRSWVSVRSRIPAWQSAAYILYRTWPENVARVRISEVISRQDSLGRIFFLTETQVMVLLSKLEQEHVIALEMIADLHQIGRNPAMKAEGFLEMLLCGPG